MSSSSVEDDDEMQAVKSRYTACVGIQDLPGSTQAVYRLVARLAGIAAGSDELPFTANEASDAVRCLDNYVKETASEHSAVSQDLSTMTEEVELYRLYAAIGDHAHVM